ncbi:hypothetical protein KC352_g37 [Hortaea werneckii]|nr:hypothetical protein KC352_g37 [Hortaea werneckii]
MSGLDPGLSILLAISLSVRRKTLLEMRLPKSRQSARSTDILLVHSQDNIEFTCALQASDWRELLACTRFGGAQEDDDIQPDGTEWCTTLLLALRGYDVQDVLLPVLLLSCSW